MADVYRIKGIIQKNLSNFSLSEEFFENSIRLNEDFNNKSNIAESSLELSDLYGNQNEDEKRESLIKEATKYYKKIKAEEKLKDLKKKYKSGNDNSVN